MLNVIGAGMTGGAGSVHSRVVFVISVPSEK